MARYAVNAAHMIWQQHKLEIPVNAADVAHALGLQVFYMPIRSLAGVLLPEEDHFLLGVNQFQGKGRRNFTIAHEIGHYLLHLGLQPSFACGNLTQPIGHLEYQANQFAVELLMPFTIVQRLSELPAENLAKRFSVSNQAMSIRLQEVNA